MINFLKKNPFSKGNSVSNPSRQDSAAAQSKKKKSQQQPSSSKKPQKRHENDWSLGTGIPDAEQQEQLAILMRISNFKLEYLRTYPSNDIRRTVIINNLLNRLCIICDYIIACSVASGQFYDPDYKFVSSTPPSKLTMFRETPVSASVTRPKSGTTHNTSDIPSLLSNPSDEKQSSTSLLSSVSPVTNPMPLPIDLQSPSSFNPMVNEGFPSFQPGSNSGSLSVSDLDDESTTNSSSLHAFGRISLGRTQKSLPRTPEAFIELKEELTAAPLVPSPLAPQAIQQAANNFAPSSHTSMRRKKSLLANGRIVIDYSVTKSALNSNATIVEQEATQSLQDQNVVPLETSTPRRLSRSSAIRKGHRSTGSVGNDESPINHVLDQHPSLNSSQEQNLNHKPQSRGASEQNSASMPVISTKSHKIIDQTTKKQHRNSTGIFFEKFLGAFSGLDTNSSSVFSAANGDSDPRDSAYCGSESDVSTIIIIDESDTLEYTQKIIDAGILDGTESDATGRLTNITENHDAISFTDNTCRTKLSVETTTSSNLGSTSSLMDQARLVQDEIPPDVKDMPLNSAIGSPFILTPPAPAVVMRRSPNLEEEPLPENSSSVSSRPRVFQSAFEAQLSGLMQKNNNRGLIQEPLSYVSLKPVVPPSQMGVFPRNPTPSNDISPKSVRLPSPPSQPFSLAPSSKPPKSTSPSLFSTNILNKISLKKAASTSDATNDADRSGKQAKKRLGILRRKTVTNMSDDSDLDDDDDYADFHQDVNFGFNEKDLEDIFANTRYR